MCHDLLHTCIILSLSKRLKYLQNVKQQVVLLIFGSSFHLHSIFIGRLSDSRSTDGRKNNSMFSYFYPILKIMKVLFIG